MMGFRLLVIALVVLAGTTYTENVLQGHASFVGMFMLYLFAWVADVWFPEEKDDD